MTEDEISDEGGDPMTDGVLCEPDGANNAMAEIDRIRVFERSRRATDDDVVTDRQVLTDLHPIHGGTYQSADCADCESYAEAVDMADKLEGEAPEDLRITAEPNRYLADAATCRRAVREAVGEREHGWACACGDATYTAPANGAGWQDIMRAAAEHRETGCDRVAAQVIGTEREPEPVDEPREPQTHISKAGSRASRATRAR